MLSDSLKSQYLIFGFLSSSNSGFCFSKFQCSYSPISVADFGWTKNQVKYLISMYLQNIYIHVYIKFWFGGCSPALPTLGYASAQHAQFSVFQMVMDKAVCTTQRNVQLSSDASQPKESVLSAKGICTTRLSSVAEVLWGPPSCLSQYLPCRQRRHCTVTTHNRFHDIKRALFSSTIGDEFPPVWHSSHARTETSRLRRHLSVFAEDVPFIRRLYGDKISLCWPLTAAWRQRPPTYVCYEMMYTVR